MEWMVKWGNKLVFFTKRGRYKMLKKIVAFALALLVGLQAFSVCSNAANESGSPKHIPRVVSIVFDDSGSMYKNTDRWAYTSYAMQSFAAMMGSQDVLYITYLNAPVGTVKVDLSDGVKSKNVRDFYSIMFGGGTPNRVEKGVDCLRKEYANYKENAKYYLVVMADGELDSGLGELSTVIKSAAATAEATLHDAEFETVYFSMKSGDKTEIPGVTSHFAASSEKIVGALKNVSAEIMGRSEVKHKVENGKLSFTLQYPALSIAVFAQKENGNFEKFKASVQKDGKPLSCQVGNYNVNCPTEIVKNLEHTVYQEVIPQNPPAGVVSLITDGGNPLAKGDYTIDVSGYDLVTDDIVVLVEPAVRIGCKYILNDDDNAITFQELKERVSEGDDVTVICGLYELNSDGSLGDPVPLEVLSPEYKIMINDQEVGGAENGSKNTYRFRVEKEYENQDLKVQALLKGYQPFVLRETFGELNIRIQPLPIPEGGNEILLTKPLWKKWSQGEEGISFELEKVDADILDKVAIKVEGVDGLPAGLCSELKDAVRVDGNSVIYTPKSALPFQNLPEAFAVRLVDLSTAETVIQKTVKVIRPDYRFDIQNQLENVTLSLEQLKKNDKTVTFTLTVDYDGSGQYIAIGESDCEEQIDISLSAGVMPGQTDREPGQISFVAQYDQQTHTDLSVEEILGKNHSIFATAEVDGQEVKSETVTLSVSSAVYRLEVKNQITEPMSLDTLKSNQLQIVFSILADYTGSGSFGPLADWDRGAADRIEINSGDLPGRIDMVYDAGGKPLGKSFTPVYDEHNNNGVPFTKVAGRIHEIVGTVASTDLRAETSVEVLTPDYEIVVQKDDIRLTDLRLRGNTKGVEFTILRDGRVLTQQELEGLAPYQTAFDKEQPWVKIVPAVMLAEDGTAYLLCVPQYDGWKFPSSWFWNWLCLFAVKKGEMHLNLTLGEDVGAAVITMTTSMVGWVIFFVVLLIIALILWIIFCFATRIRFLRGVFYKVTFTPSASGVGYVVSSRTVQNANQKGLLKFLLSGKMLIPFSEQRASVSSSSAHRAEFVTKKNPTKTFGCRSYPYCVGKTNKAYFNKGKLSHSAVRSIVNREDGFKLNAQSLVGVPCSDTEKKLDMGDYLVDKKSRMIIFFLTKNEERSIKERKRTSKRTNTKKTSVSKRSAGKRSGTRTSVSTQKTVRRK